MAGSARSEDRRFRNTEPWSVPKSPARHQPRCRDTGPLMARLKRASSRAPLAICSQIRIALIYFSFSGGFCPINLPLFQGTWDSRRCVCVSMAGSFLVERNQHCHAPERAVTDPGAIFHPSFPLAAQHREADRRNLEGTGAFTLQAHPADSLRPCRHDSARECKSSWC